MSINGSRTPIGNIALGCDRQIKSLIFTTKSIPKRVSDKRGPVRTEASSQTHGKLCRVYRCKGRVVFSHKLENLHPFLDSEEETSLYTLSVTYH